MSSATQIIVGKEPGAHGSLNVFPCLLCDPKRAFLSLVTASLPKVTLHE